MKIFNWVHRRFCNDKGSSGLSEDSIIRNDKSNINILENLGGILSIGTFGYEPLVNDVNTQFYDDLLWLESEILDNKKVMGCIGDDNDEEEDEEVIIPHVVFNENDNEIDFEYAMIEKTKKERTTLADLFSIEEEKVVEGKTKLDNDATVNAIKRKVKTKHRKHVLLKKILTGGGESRPHLLKKLRQLVRKMMKRKIHPDVFSSMEDKCEAIASTILLDDPSSH